jgi:hypothetical protein
MKNKDTESAVAVLLDGHADCRQDWEQSPHVSHIPFMGTREKFFLLVNVHVRLEANNRERLLNTGFRAVQLIIESGLITDEKAVEISGFVEVPGQSNLRRIFRLSALDVAFSQMTQIDAQDLLEQKYEGITCQWPLQTPL